MKNRGGAATYFDTITRSFIKVGGDLITTGLGIGGLALGWVPGIGDPISEMWASQLIARQPW